MLVRRSGRCAWTMRDGCLASHGRPRGLGSALHATIDEIWRLAREDAGFAPEEVRVYVLRGAKRGDYWAMDFKPGNRLVFDQNFPFSLDPPLFGGESSGRRI
jgi:hypothetical protein